MSSILSEIDIIAAFDKARGVEVEDWLSSFNPRKKRLLVVPRCDRTKGSLKPSPLVILAKKRQTSALLLDIIPAFSMFTARERREKIRDTLVGYHAFLSTPNKAEKWLAMRKVFLPPKNLAIAIVVTANDNKMAAELVEECRALDSHTPIFFASFTALLKNPLHCWQSNASPADIPCFFKIKRNSTRNF